MTQATQVNVAGGDQQVVAAVEVVCEVDEPIAMPGVGLDVVEEGRASGHDQMSCSRRSTSAAR